MERFMPQMISKVAHEYGGRDLKVGDVFDVEPQFVEMLTALGRARLVEDEEPTMRQYGSRVMCAQDPSATKVAPPAAPAAAPQTEAYRRRDMTAAQPRGQRRKRQP
jgi:hypothetical protein